MRLGETSIDSRLLIGGSHSTRLVSGRLFQVSFSVVQVWCIIFADVFVTGANHAPDVRRRRGKKIVVTGASLCASFSDETGVMFVPWAHFDRLRRIVRGGNLPMECLRMGRSQRSILTVMAPGSCCGGWIDG